jgi:hypothetical protein
MESTLQFAPLTYALAVLHFVEQADQLILGSNVFTKTYGDEWKGILAVGNSYLSVIDVSIVEDVGTKSLATCRVDNP